LARTHQSNQRFQEDTTSFKKIQRDAALQMKSIKERDESERLALLETVRARTIEHAFQYDMELAIQRAADGMIASQLSIPQGSNNGNSKKCSLLEEENAGLCVQLSDEELKVVICVCVCMYVYIYIYIRIHICIYICIYI
jgi:hypothetical protein